MVSTRSGTHTAPSRDDGWTPERNARWLKWAIEGLEKYEAAEIAAAAASARKRAITITVTVTIAVAVAVAAVVA